jgi:hypothetical protein
MAVVPNLDLAWRFFAKAEDARAILGRVLIYSFSGLVFSQIHRFSKSV